MTQRSSKKVSAEKVAHTPGPWAISSESYPFLVRDARGAKVAHVGAPRADTECVANARLIAAAPDLLALAKRYASECSECGGTGVKLVWAENADHNDAWDHSEPCEACADIRAVIAKAEGRE